MMLANAICLLLVPGTGVNGLLMAACLWPVFVLVFSVGTRPTVRGLAGTAALAGALSIAGSCVGLSRDVGTDREWQPFLASATAVLASAWGPAAVRLWGILGCLTSLILVAATCWIVIRAVISRRWELLAAPAIIGCTVLLERDHRTARLGRCGRRCPCDASRSGY